MNSASRARTRKSSLISHGVVSTNRKARFNYSLGDSIEAGIVLLGSEVKSLRAGRVNLTDAYAAYRDGEFFLQQLHIDSYDKDGVRGHEPRRHRKLLLHRRQIRKLALEVAAGGYTLVPLQLVFNNQGKAKVVLALGKGKHHHDKRHTIKEREWNREKLRVLKRG